MVSQITTGAGRIVWGNPLNGRPKKAGNPPQIVMKNGVQVIEYSFGLAIPKAEFAALGAIIEAEAKAVCPQGIPAGFASKVKDGDTDKDKNGQPLANKPGYAGCYVIALSTEIPIKCFKRDGDKFVPLTEGIKTGDYVRARVNVKGHGATPGVLGAKAGLYWNPDMVEFLGYGDAIQGAADPNDAFGAPVALPQGASQTPTAPSVGMPSTLPGQQPASPPAAPPVPNTGFPWGGGN